MASELVKHSEFALSVLVPSHRRLEITRVGEAVRADWAKIGQFEVALVHLADVAARRAIQFHRKDDAPLDDANLAWCHLHFAKLGGDVQHTLLWHDEEISVGVVHATVDHRDVGRVHVNCHPVSCLRGARTT
jgi:hypothetical protein